ncbi:TauD/TfdA family dioxygenase [Pseudomonas aeruginosa]|nr:TauD/TfdA family dioxygenase [Pseudomonas aeruginosa]
MDLRQWIAAAGAGLRDSLLRHGGILFRGFAVDGARASPRRYKAFRRTCSTTERAAARQEVAHRVFTSTEFSPDGWIPPHHEMSYSHNWPSYIHFYCQTPPATQGRTPWPTSAGSALGYPRRSGSASSAMGCATCATTGRRST